MVLHNDPPKYNVGYVHRELIENLPYYQVIDDCLKGELVIKWRRERYLPRASRDDNTASAKDRYETILADAVFYNVVRAHAEFMTGQVFMRPPIIDLPEKLDKIKENSDGNGLPFVQLARQLVWDLVTFSRFGIFVDYPHMEYGNTTAYEIDSGQIFPMITRYRPWQIANWRTELRAGREVLTLVVIQEIGNTTTDGYDHVDFSRIKVLRLNTKGQFQVEIYKSDVISELVRFGRPDYNYFDSRIGLSSQAQQNRYYTDYLASYPANFLADFRTRAHHELISKTVPTDSKGQPFDRIPFVFGGSRFNTPEVERPQMFDIASVNLGHYRDSALNQQMLRYSGSGTPWFSGLNRQWIKQVMRGRLALGSSAAIKLPTGGSAGMLQGVANSSIREAMQDKWNYMAALGARVLTGSQMEQKTATEFSLETSEFNSGLALIALNVGKALSEALKFAGQYLGIEEQPNVDLLTEYGMDRLSPNQRHQLLAEVQGGLLSWTEGRSKLSDIGLAYLEDEVAREEIEKRGIPKVKGKMEEFARPAFGEVEEKREQQAKNDDGFRKENEKSGPQPKD